MVIMYHVENPIRQSWCDTLEFFASKLELSRSDYLPYDQWLKDVFATDSDHNSVKNLAEFFAQYFKRLSGGSLILWTNRARHVSPTLRKSASITKETIRLYVFQWRAVGFLSKFSEKVGQ